MKVALVVLVVVVAGFVLYLRPVPVAGAPPQVMAPSTSATEPRAPQQGVVSGNTRTEQPREDASKAPNTPAKPAEVVPVEVRDAYDRMCRVARTMGSSLPSQDKLNASQWAMMHDIQDSFEPKLLLLQHSRVLRLNEIGKQRMSRGSMELLCVEHPTDPQALREIAAKKKPEFAGQQVQLWATPSGTYVLRANPGEDEDLDSTTDSIMMTWRLYIDAARAATNS